MPRHVPKAPIRRAHVLSYPRPASRSAIQDLARFVLILRARSSSKIPLRVNPSSAPPSLTFVSSSNLLAAEHPSVWNRRSLVKCLSYFNLSSQLSPSRGVGDCPLATDKDKALSKGSLTSPPPNLDVTSRGHTSPFKMSSSNVPTPQLDRPQPIWAGGFALPLLMRPPSRPACLPCYSVCGGPARNRSCVGVRASSFLDPTKMLIHFSLRVEGCLWWSMPPPPSF
jgi:hypothetical protein